MGKECSDWGATRSEVRVGAFLSGSLGLSIRRGMVWIKEEVPVVGAELASVRVEGNEAREVIARYVGRNIAGHKKDLITSR